ncbi:MAG TPA: class I SAM-dependent methyltransferase [Ignavibacteriaceae bacterium]|mgnify:CR=1 FL=1|jgi:ubiquinone/menaquinone biosynthesis C-methylase UbiE|nr:class I SAM-dependent methyltransferase [Ignavibacteriaceae bacterium]
MNEQKPTIHEFDFNLIWEYFIHFERQGPGSPESTMKALSFIDNLSSESKIADLGCGTGGQTFILAQNTKAAITALDLFPAAIDKLNTTTERLGLQDRIKGIVGSMDNLSFQNGELDLIWSEGAIDSIGFEKCLNYWKSFLKTGGYFAVTNLTWFTSERPAELQEYYLNAVPGIGTMGQSISIIEKAGYTPIAAFALSEKCWTDTYIAPQKAVNETFLKKYAGNKTVETFISNMKYEAELYSKYKQYYGYVFYIGKKIE